MKNFGLVVKSAKYEISNIGLRQIEFTKVVSFIDVIFSGVDITLIEDLSSVSYLPSWNPQFSCQ